MRTKTLIFLLFLFVLSFSAGAMADPVTGPYAGFSLYAINSAGQTSNCAETWILPNNTPYDNSSPFPIYRNFTMGNTCSQGTWIVDEIAFPGGFGGGFFMYGGAFDLFGATLWGVSSQGNIQFEKGQFALTDEFDYEHFTLDIHEASEPSSAALLGVALALFVGWRMRKGSIA